MNINFQQKHDIVEKLLYLLISTEILTELTKQYSLQPFG
jgi:hypothetical protein